MLVVDNRWVGAHGIGRFSRELLSRLDLDWTDLGATGNPLSPFDVVNPRRLGLSSSDCIFTPGFNAGFTRAHQILTIHDLIHLRVPSESSVGKRIYYSHVIKPAVMKAGLVLTVSETSRTAIEDWIGSSNVRVVNVGNGCSDAFKLDRAASASREGYFVYVGNLKPHKHFDILLQALTHRPNYRLVVVTADARSAGQKASALNLGDRISVRSNLSDEELASLYQSSRGLLFPSELEGFGLPALEAISSGTSVAYWTGCQSVAEIVGAYGTPVESLKDPGAWARAMDTLQSLAGVTAPSQEWRGRYTWEAVALRVAIALREHRDI